MIRTAAVERPDLALHPLATESGSVALRDLARFLVESWNRSDAQAFAALFSPAAEYVTGAGARIRGPEAISRLIEEAARAAQVTLVDEPFVESDGRRGQFSFAWSAAEPKGGARRGTIRCSCVRHNGGWLIDSLHNDEAGSVGETWGSPTRR